MLFEARRRIRRETVTSLTQFRGMPRWTIENRLARLEREWSRARDVKTGAACAAFAGLALATLLDTRWMLLPRRQSRPRCGCGTQGCAHASRSRPSAACCTP